MADANAAPPFPFVQFEFGFLLGPADGRYLVRPDPDEEPERVVVLGTLGAPQRRLMGGRRPRAVDGAEPEPVPTQRATLVRAKPLEDKAEADRWLGSLRRESDALAAEVADAQRALNAVLRAHRAAAADPYGHDVGSDHALAVRVGYGVGDQVANGRFTEAYELPRGASKRRRRRIDALAPQERLASILGGREALPACEELVLRARADLQAERPREAALQARIALEAVSAELADSDEARGELEEHRAGIAEAANAALEGEPDDESMRAVRAAVDRMELTLRRRSGGRSS